MTRRWMCESGFSRESCVMSFVSTKRLRKAHFIGVGVGAGVQNQSWRIGQPTPNPSEEGMFQNSGLMWSQIQASIALKIVNFD